MTIKRVATGGGPFEEATVLLRRMRELQATLGRCDVFRVEGGELSQFGGVEPRRFAPSSNV